MDPMAGEINRQCQSEVLSHCPREIVLPKEVGCAHRRTCGCTMIHLEALDAKRQLLYFYGTLSIVGCVLSDHHDECSSTERSPGELKQHFHGCFEVF